MHCNNIQEQLSAYLDGQLSAEDSQRIEGHLKSCEACGRAFDQMRKTVAHLRGLEELEPPSWLEQKVMAKIREEAEQRPGILRKLFFPLHIKIPIEVFATIAVAVTAFYIFRTVEPDLKTPVQTFDEQAVTESAPEKAVPGIEETADVPVTSERDRKAAYSADMEVRHPETPKSGRVPLVTVPAEEKRAEHEAPDAFEEGAAPGRMFREPGLKKESKAPAPAAGFQLTDQAAVLDVYVRDVTPAIEKVTTLVNDSGGEVIGTELFADRGVVFARIPAQELELFMQRTRLIGDVNKKAFMDRPHGDTVIRIEILKMSSGSRP